MWAIAYPCTGNFVLRALYNMPLSRRSPVEERHSEEDGRQTRGRVAAENWRGEVTACSLRQRFYYTISTAAD